jgi:hypothetical protein
MSDEPVIEKKESDKTTIPCKKPTRLRVKELGKKGESYDSVLNKTVTELEMLRIKIKELEKERV